MSSFLERFKGKTSIMGKDGLSGLLNEGDKPINKPNLISIINENDNPPHSLKTRSMNIINSQELDFKKTPAQRNFHSISSQSNKPSHLIQAAKNSIGMSTYDFGPVRNISYSNGQNSYSNGPNTESKITYSASPFISKSYVNQKPRVSPFSISLNVKKEELKGGGLGKIKVSDYKNKREKIKGNKGIAVIKEQNEEPEEDFEEIEKKHLQFLNVIEKMNFK